LYNLLTLRSRQTDFIDLAQCFQRFECSVQYASILIVQSAYQRRNNSTISDATEG